MATIINYIHTHWPQVFVTESYLDYFQLKPEQDDRGNVEYKRILTNCSVKRINNYTTQMLWRIMQSPKQRAIYYIGLDDNGSVYGLNTEQVKLSLNTFMQMVNELKAQVTKIHLICIENKYILQIKIKLKANLPKFYDAF